MLKRFKDSNGRVVSGQKLVQALNAVADEYEKLAFDIRKEDAYASHVTESQKDEALAKSLDHADQVRRGESVGFTTAQRLNMYLTGDCIALFHAE